MDIHLLLLKKYYTLALAFLSFANGFFSDSYPAGLETENSSNRAGSYSMAALSCAYGEKTGAEIRIGFKSSENTPNKIPDYEIQEFPDVAKTVAVFYGVGDVKKTAVIDEIPDNPLVDSLEYNLKNGNLILEINRKGAFLPAGAAANGHILAIYLKPGDDSYPSIFARAPEQDSAAFPAFRTIKFKAAVNGEMQKASVTFNGRPVEFSATSTDPGVYSFQFNGIVEKDKEYRVRTVITDGSNRTAAGSWTFRGGIPVEAILGKDRFKYLGWWGEINVASVSVRKEPRSDSAKTGELASANRVKVIREVTGETIDYNYLWYEIDGGTYPHSYVFSEYVTPIAQPEPPLAFKIPESVGSGNRWIDVDLTKRVLTLFDYDKPVFATYVSPGRPENPTETGTFRIWYKLKKAEMRGGPPLHSYRYDLKNIPWVMYYNNSYAIHGTYWHDRFGTPQSAGCTNMTQGDAAYIFERTKPELASGQQALFTKEENPGTVVHNHE